MNDAPGSTPVISVVVPVHNEAAYLPEAVPRLFGELAAVAAAYEVILVENGSTDGTADVAEALRDRFPPLAVLRLAEPDYGAAMRAGFLAGRGEWRVNFDIDYFSGDFVGTVLATGGDADVILSSKRSEGAHDERSRFRRLATLVFNLLLRVGFGSRVTDTHGIKAVRGTVVADLVPTVRSTKDLFDTELVLRAERAGYRIAEVPARVVEERPTAQGLLKRVPRTLLGLARLRLWFWREGRSGRGRSAPPRHDGVSGEEEQRDAAQ